MKSCPKCGKEYPDDANFCPVDAGHLVPKEGAPEEMRRLDTAGHELLNGRFGVGDLIGGHRTGAVHQCLDKQGTTAGVKFVDPKVFPTPLLQQRSEREIKQLERLRHPGVVSILDHGKRDSGMWLACERADGMALDKFVAQNGPLAQDAAVGVLARIGAALEEAAKHGVVHRDLSAKNVLIDQTLAPRLINFGVPVPYDERIQGVLEYVAPEQIEGRPVDQRCNIYSLGVIGYFLFTGKTPFEGSPQEVLEGHARRDVQPPGQLAAISPQVEAVLMKALEKSSSKRYMTLRQFLSALEAAASGQDVQTLQGAGAAGKNKGAETDMAKTLIGMSAIDAGAAAAAQGGAGPEVTERDLGAAAAAAQHHAAAQQGQPQVAPAQPQVAPAQPQVAPAQPQVAPAQPQVAPAQPQMAAGGKGAGKGQKKKPAAASSNKGKFRETMWFKKGELDEAAAEAAAKARPEEMASTRADAMEMDERYTDDGTLTSQDQDRLSLRTGATMMMDAVQGSPRAASQVSEEELVSEMTAGRGKLILGVIVAVIVVGGVVALALTR
jgi:serine/threonine-protein kinase